MNQTIFDQLEQNPIIAAADHSGWQAAVASNAKVLYLTANILTVSEDIRLAKEAGKSVFIHLDLTEGIGKDRAGVQWLKQLHADGIISTRIQTVRLGAECGLLTVQRIFLLDSKGMHSGLENLESSQPDFVEILPGVVPKALRFFSRGTVPVIAGGLIETRNEVTAALSAGALAISTGKRELWNE